MNFPTVLGVLESGVLTRTERIGPKEGQLNASTAVESGDVHSSQVPANAQVEKSDSHEFGPLKGRSGPFARWEGFEPPAA